ncbi:hypothetical protein ACJW30_12G007600 [Castanea mollissima]
MDQAVVKLLINNIISILSTEAPLLWGTRDTIEDIKDELISMQLFLVDADRKGVGSEGEKNWVAIVRDMAYNVEDIIDKFVYHMNRQRIGGRYSWILHHSICFPKNLWVRRQTATKIQKINGKIKGAIPERNQRYGIDRIEGTSSKDNQKWVVRHAESSLFFKEDELVGIEKKRQLIMDWLMDGEPHLTIISIVGMGGSGKTTLAANIYNNEDVNKHFDCCAWITISQAYELEDILRSLIKEFHESRKETNPADLNSMNYRLLVKTLVNYLEKKRYLLVLDDVWDTNLLDELKVSLRDSCFGSRIILTTRKEDDVACHQMGGKHHIHQMELLLKEEAWELFCKKAFSSSPNGSCPPELKSFAQKLVGKCDGLPLAIVALGSLMYSKNMSEWNKIYNSLNWSLSKNPELEAVKSILLLSFNDLPYQLKHYHEIRRKRLIKLWMAEGFEVAESCLLELIFRSMIQVVERNEFGRPKRCKMHDILRELALSISERERRLIAKHAAFQFTKLMEKSNHLQMLKTLPFGSKMLRVLDLEDAPIDDLPDELFKLFNLRYLNLRITLVKELPKSVLPCEIGELQNLLHLILHQFTGNWSDFKFVIGPRTPSNICRLKNLQVVTYLEIKGDLLKQIRSMTQLTMIGLTNVKASDEMDLCDSIHNMKLMRYLCVMVRNAEETLRMDALSSPPTNLQKLLLAGKLEKVPQWFHSLQSLTYLCLRWSRLEEDLLPQIAALPQLRHLDLINAYVGKQLCFSTGFLNLTSLEKGVMPNLKSLDIISCMQLNTVPKGIEYLQNLQELLLASVLMELQNRIKGEGSVDFPKVQHIPNIYIY